MCRFPEPDGPLRRPASASFRATHSRRPRTSATAAAAAGLDVLDRSSEEARFATNRYSVALAGIGLGDETFTIGTTHFPWTEQCAHRPISSAPPATPSCAR